MFKSIQQDMIKGSYSIDPNPKKGEKYTLHCHSFYEIYFFIAGDLDYLVEGHSYRPHPYSLLLIPPNAFHGVQHKSTREYQRYSCHFMAELLPVSVRSKLLSPFHREQIFFTNLIDHQLNFYLDSVLTTPELPKSIQKPALEGRMISLLSEIYKISSTQLGAQETREDNRFSIDYILIYINDNLDRKIILDDICNQFYISKNHLNRLFKNSTGTTVNSYINYKRLTLAKQYMLQEQTATEAALNAGFGDYSNFYRTCRNLLGVSPSELQNRNILGVKEFWQ